MTSPRIAPCIWLAGTSSEAVALYLRAFTRTPVEAPPAELVTVLEVGGLRLSLLDGGPIFRPNPSISFFVHVDAPDDADRIVHTLADGGRLLMPLGAYPWSPRYAWVEDRFGVSWQVIAGRREGQGAAIVPCLMFAGTVHGRAREAMEFYASALPGGRIERIEEYGPGEGPEGTVKHGRFVAAGLPLIAMDSHGPHEFTFGEGLSLQLDCADQAEVDAAWATLGEGGAHGPCGWLKDRFGVSWQVVPTALGRLMRSGDAAARGRVMTALRAMSKLDVATLEAAHAAG